MLLDTTSAYKYCDNRVIVSELDFGGDSIGQISWYRSLRL